MNATQMKERLASLRVGHAPDPDVSFLLEVIDTMVARSWNPVSGGEQDFSADELVDRYAATLVDEDGLEAWIAELRGVISPPATKDRILALMTSPYHVVETVAKTIILAFAGEVEEKTRREVLDNLTREGVITEPLLGKEPKPVEHDGHLYERALDLERLIGRAIIDEIRSQE